MAEREDGRTHEPNLREVVAELDGLRELTLARFDAIMQFSAERDRRYEERFTAMDDKTGLALTSSKEAVGKAEVATEKRFDAMNEFRGALSDQATTLMPKGEALAKFESYDEKIAALKEQMDKGSGKWAGANNLWLVLLAVGMAALAVMTFLKTPH
jgi:hypothetical protein